VSNHDFDIEVSKNYRLFRSNASEVEITDGDGVVVYGPHIDSLNLSNGKLFGILEKVGSKPIKFIFDTSNGKAKEFIKASEWEAALAMAGIDPKTELLKPLAFRKSIKAMNRLGSEHD
jgi:hypothetical protein